MGAYYSSSTSASSEGSDFYIDRNQNINEGDKFDEQRQQKQRGTTEPTSMAKLEDNTSDVIKKSTRSLNNINFDDLNKSLDEMRNDISEQKSIKKRFNDSEYDLYQCYAANRNRTINCSNLVRDYKRLIMSAATIIVILSFITPVFSFGAMSVDLGSEWMKVGIVAPNMMDIALSVEGERKVPMAVAYNGNDVQTGYVALKTASKYPEKVFTHFLDLVGKSIDHESVADYKRHFPYANISASLEPNSTSILLNHPDGITVTPLELTSLMLKHAHNQVLTHLNDNTNINDVVITIPPFFEWAERRIIIQAAQSAGLRVLKLIHTNSAFAFSYGIFRHTDYAQNSSVIFVDQGASSTSVTVADYHLSFNDTLPTITIRAEVYDRSLGGFEMELKLRDYLVKAFSTQSGISEEKVRNRTRSMYKLLQEAKKVKKVLSANTVTNARVENVIDNTDLMMPVTRIEFEEICSNLLDERSRSLFSRLPQENLPELLIIVGGNTRIPKLQQVLKDYFKTNSLGKYINADDSAALAALHHAASLTPGFKVKQFLLNEYPRPIDPEEILPTPVLVEEILPPPVIVEELSPSVAEELSPSVAEELSPSVAEELSPSVVGELSPSNYTTEDQPSNETVGMALPHEEL